MLLQIEVITVCNETKQHKSDETSDNNPQENPAPPKMSEEEKKKRLKERASEYLMFIDN